MSPNNRSLLASAVLALSLAVPAHATLSRAVPFDEKVEQSSAIVLGTCTKTQSAWTDDHRWIVTYSTFKVEKTIKGTNTATELTVVTPGGTVGDVAQDSIGVPTFREGDQAVLFVKPSKLGLTVSYFDQGAYGVTTDGNGEKVVTPVSTGAVHLDTQRGVAVPAEAPRTLRDFERAVRESVTRNRAEQMALIQAKQQAQSSFWSVVLQYKALIALALIGIAIATWQLLRR